MAARAGRRTSAGTLYNLYHVLNHLNLFGGGYLSQAQAMIERLLAATGVVSRPPGPRTEKTGAGAGDPAPVRAQLEGLAHPSLLPMFG